jgi:hypothetical protein
VFGFDVRDAEGGLPGRHNRQLTAQRFTGIATNDDMLRFDLGEQVDITAYGQGQSRPCRVVGDNRGLFFHAVTAVAAGINLDAYFTLAAGGDLSRKRDRGAASAGEHLIDA